MEFNVGNKVIIQETDFYIRVTDGVYAIASNLDEKIVNGGYIPIVLKKANNEKGYEIIKDSDVIIEVLKNLLYKK